MVLPIIGPYGMSKWAVEAMAEVLAIETGHFGVRVSLVQPGVVATNGGAKAKVYRTDDDPYGPLFDELVKTRGEVVTPEEVATVVADTIEQENPPLRVPAGVSAVKVLAARNTSPENEIFFPFDVNW
jgi:NAD(P)-dependent dehydrogenase (short-subunit alcohol dehydrogenase family)